MRLMIPLPLPTVPLGASFCTNGTCERLATLKQILGASVILGQPTLGAALLIKQLVSQQKSMPAEKFPIGIQGS